MCPRAASRHRRALVLSCPTKYVGDRSDTGRNDLLAPRLARGYLAVSDEQS